MSASQSQSDTILGMWAKSGPSIEIDSCAELSLPILPERPYPYGRLSRHVRSGTRFWRIDPRADYGKLNVVSQHRLKLQRIAPHWDDMLRLNGSLLLGRVPAAGIMRTLQVGDNPTRLAQAIAEFGRIDKTLHSLRYIDDRDMRRGNADTAQTD
jgi:Tn3 transposase DDE domain-containing protein